MKFKVGDKVKFLNEKGGGVVSKIISSSLVNIAIEEGFEIPHLTSEIIKVETEDHFDSPKHMFHEDYQVKIETPMASEYESDTRNVPLLKQPAKGVLADGIYFAFLPHDQKWLITGMLDVYLVNQTEYDILYNIFLESERGKYSGFDYGSINAESMVLLETLERDDVGKWENGFIQVMYHKDRDRIILNPGNSQFRVQGSRFYQEGSYKESGILNGKAILVSLLPMSASVTLYKNEAMSKDEAQDNLIVKSVDIEPEHIIDKHRTGPTEAVVDLHLSELVEDEDSLENTEKLRIQVNYFTKCIESAIANHFSKVTFIHGVGTGVLKTTIKEILKDYPNIEYRDASMKQFGYGATDIIIRYK